MSNNPWEQKSLIRAAEQMADSEGFRLGADLNFNNKICLFTKGENEHGFANDIVLQAFDDWQSVIHFMAGWKKRGLAMRVATAKKPEKSA